MKFDRKKGFFLLYIVLFTTNAFAQTIDKTLEFRKKGKIEKSLKLDFVTDSNNSKIAIITHFEKFSAIHLLDSSLNEIGQFEVQTREKSFFKGGVFSGDSLMFCFLADTYKETVLTTVYYSLSGKSLVIKNTDVTFYNENALDMFMSGGMIFLLTAKKGLPILNLHSFTSSGEKRSTKSYNFNGVVSPSTNQTVSGFFSLDERKPALIRNLFEPDFARAVKAQRKIYIANDSVYILENSNLGITEIYSFSLHQNGQKYRSIYHGSAADIIKSGGKKVKDNSFLCNNVLFYVAINADSLRFVVTDFVTGKELQSFTTGNSKAINFRNSDVARYGGNNKDIVRKLIYEKAGTLDLFHAIFRGDLVVYAEEKGNVYEVMIGAHRRYFEKDELNMSTRPASFGRLGFNDQIYSSSEEIEEIFEFITLIDKEHKNYVNPAVNKTKSLREIKSEKAEKKKIDMLDLQYARVGSHNIFLYYNSFRKHLKLYEM
nr:hypothetical protein [uncultured Lacibacter sp.]